MNRETNLQESFAKLQSTIESNLKPARYNPKEHIDHQRARIANVFVWGFFILIGLVVILIPTYNYLIYNTIKNNELLIDLKDILSIIGSIVGSSLGFVIGYYFKSGEK